MQNWSRRGVRVHFRPDSEVLDAGGAELVEPMGPALRTLVVRSMAPIHISCDRYGWVPTLSHRGLQTYCSKQILGTSQSKWGWQAQSASSLKAGVT